MHTQDNHVGLSTSEKIMREEAERTGPENWPKVGVQTVTQDPGHEASDDVEPTR